MQTSKFSLSFLLITIVSSLLAGSFFYLNVGNINTVTAANISLVSKVSGASSYLRTSQLVKVNTGAGNLIVLGVTWADNAVSVSNITDTFGNTYIPAVSSSTNLGSAIYYVPNALGGGTNTITVTFSSGTSNIFLGYLQYSGIANTSPLDVSSAGSGTSSNVSSVSPFTTNQADEVIIALTHAGGTMGSISDLIPASGYTSQLATILNLMEDRITANTMTDTGGATWRYRQNWNSLVVTFKAAEAIPDTTPPIRSNGSPTYTLSSGTTQTILSLTTNESAICKYGTTAGTSYPSIANTFSSTGGTTHSSTLTDLIDGSTYTYSIRCQDLAGNFNTDDYTISFLVAYPPTPDTMPPSVSISFPTNGAIISSITTLQAIASDNIGVAGVQFKLDGINLNTEDTTAPYSTTWDTTQFTNAPHTLTAVARDAAGNTATSTEIIVTVDNTGKSQHYATSVFYSSNTLGRGSISYVNSLSACTEAGWQTGHDAVNGTNIKSAYEGTVAGTGCDSNISSRVKISRGFLNFDTSNLPDDAIIQSATVHMFITKKQNNVNDGMDFVSVVHGLQNPGLNLGLADYSNSGNAISNPVEGSNRIDIGDIPTQDYESWSLNAEGLSWINVSGSTLLSFREGHDILGTWPQYSSNIQNSVQGQFSLNLDISSDPYLEIVYISSDVTPPSVSLQTFSVSTPRNASVLPSQAIIAATASDNLGVAGVQFKIDGVNYAPEVTYRPYTIGWDTTKFSNGGHIISAIARDDNGNTASATLPISIYNPPNSIRIPLTDMTTGNNYLGFSGGLYANGNIIPPDHEAVGMARSAQIQPLNTAGQPDPNGKIILMSMGMSNTTQSFLEFIKKAQASPNVNHNTLAIVDGAAGNQVANTWDSPADYNYDRVRDNVLAPRGYTENQIQIVWLKVADLEPTVFLTSESADAYQLETYIGSILRAIKIRYPHIQQVFLSSRTYGGYGTGYRNPEPYAYESGFSVKWAIQSQIDQMQGGVILDSRAGDLNYNTVAPWIAWGPYLWTDGIIPRSDGLIWERKDVHGDLIHPSYYGRQKVADMLMNFLSTSPYTRCWFTAGGCN